MNKQAYHTGLAQALINTGAMKYGGDLTNALKRFGRSLVDRVVTNEDGSSVLDTKKVTPPIRMTDSTNNTGRVSVNMTNRPERH